MKNSIALFFLFVLSILSYGQSNSEAELKLKAAMMEADQQRAIAIANEKLARESQADVKRLELQVKQLRYMAIANEIAEQSIEIRDRELSALLAVLAYNFNGRYGNTFNNKTYSALSNAIKRYDHLYVNKELIMKSLGADIRSTSAVMPDGQTKVEAEQNGYLRLVTNGITKMTLSGHSIQVDQIRFNRAGTLMVTAAKDNTIRIWNLRQPSLRPLVITENVAIGNLTVSPDGKQIIYTLATKPRTTKVQYLDSEVVAAELCKLITRNLTLEQWQTYVAGDLDYEVVCNAYPPGK